MASAVGLQAEEGNISCTQDFSSTIKVELGSTIDRRVLQRSTKRIQNRRSSCREARTKVQEWEWESLEHEICIARFQVFVFPRSKRRNDLAPSNDLTRRNPASAGNDTKQSESTDAEISLINKRHALFGRFLCSLQVWQPRQKRQVDRQRDGREERMLETRH